jgi:hypothetical protein
MGTAAVLRLPPGVMPREEIVVPRPREGAEEFGVHLCSRGTEEMK